MRRCSECGYTWPMPHKEPHARFSEGIELTPHLQSAAHLVGEQILIGAEGDAEIKEALSHCPQCGSGHYTEFRADQNPDHE
jgi:hypothetical protein